MVQESRSGQGHWKTTISQPLPVRLSSWMAARYSWLGSLTTSSRNSTKSSTSEEEPGTMQCPPYICIYSLYMCADFVCACFCDTLVLAVYCVIHISCLCRYNHLSESLTHVVLGVQEPSTVDSIRNLAQM